MERLGLRLYGLALHTLPAPLRARMGEVMLETFRLRQAERFAQRGSIGVAGVWLHELSGLVPK